MIAGKFWYSKKHHDYFMQLRVEGHHISINYCILDGSGEVKEYTFMFSADKYKGFQDAPDMPNVSKTFDDYVLLGFGVVHHCE